MQPQQAAEWVSEPRFEPFLSATNSVYSDAEALYLWHARMAGACFETLHHFEVLTRSAIDRRLGNGQPDAPVTDTWLLDSAILRSQGRAKVNEVMERLAREGYPRERKRVVASLSFAFWRNLFNGEYEQLWRTDLRHAFPGAGLRRQVLEPMTRIHLWRNRLAHHDSLLKQRVDYRFVDMVQIATFVDPLAGTWLRDNSQMLAALGAKP